MRVMPNRRTRNPDSSHGSIKPMFVHCLITAVITLVIFFSARKLVSSRGSPVLHRAPHSIQPYKITYNAPLIVSNGTERSVDVSGVSVVIFITDMGSPWR